MRGKKFYMWKKLCLLIFVMYLLAGNTAWAAQTITINRWVGGEVYGNSSVTDAIYFLRDLPPNNNVVNISAPYGYVVGAVYGANVDILDNSDVTGNTVNVNGGTVEGNVIGGGSSYGVARNNTVIMTGGAVGGIIGGFGGLGGALAAEDDFKDRPGILTFLGFLVKGAWGAVWTSVAAALGAAVIMLIISAVIGLFGWIFG